MPSRTFEDYLRMVVGYGGTSVRVVVDEGGQVVVTVSTPEEPPKMFVVRGSQVTPLTFDSPSQGE